MIVPDFVKNQNQALTLPLGRDGAASTVKTLQGVPQRHVLLEDLQIVASQLGLVTDILVAGASCMASDKGADILMFHPEAYAEGIRSIGVVMPKALSFTVKATLAANGTILANVGAQPVPPMEKGEAPPDPAEAGSDLAYVFGLDSVVVPALGAAIGELTARATRNTTLGAIFVDVSANPLDVTIEYIKINNRPMLVGRQDATIDALGVSFLGYLCTDIDGRVLAQDVAVGDTVTIGLRNANAAAVTAYGGIFCMHDDGDEE